MLRTALPWHAVLTTHFPQRPANRNLLSPADGTLCRPADCIPPSCRRWGECYTINSSAGTDSRYPPTAPFGQYFLVARCCLNPEAHCKQHELCLTEGSLLCAAQPCRALRIALPSHSTHHPHSPALPGFTYFVGHLLHESASCPGCLQHGLVTPPPVTPCDARPSWASSGSHKGQPLTHSPPLVPRVTVHLSPPTPTAPHLSSPQYASQHDTCAMLAHC